MDSDKEKGQILLITLLVLSVALTIALSLISRSTVDTSISTQVEESSRAFSAAEAGIEQALKLGVAPGTIALSQSKTNTNITQTTITSDASGNYIVGTVASGDGRNIWLVPHNGNLPDYGSAANFKPNNDLTICWDNTGNPAIEAIVYYLDSGVYKTARIGFDTVINRTTPSINTDNNYIKVNGTGCNGTATNSSGTIHFSNAYAASPPGMNIPIGAKMILMRIRPIYSQAYIVVHTNVSLPDLGNTFVSCGSSIPGVTRCISAEQLYPEPPEYFDYVLYANNGSIN
jgi:hypothetical protein